jgi:hypothetical protein
MNSSKFSFISEHSVADIDGSVHSRSGLRPREAMIIRNSQHFGDRPQPEQHRVER